MPGRMSCHVACTLANTPRDERPEPNSCGPSRLDTYHDSFPDTTKHSHSQRPNTAHEQDSRIRTQREITPETEMHSENGERSENWTTRLSAAPNTPFRKRKHCLAHSQHYTNTTIFIPYQSSKAHCKPREKRIKHQNS